MGELRWDTICNSGLRREAEPSLGGVSAHVGSRDAAAAVVLGWESCACRAWGRLLHGLRQVPGFEYCSITRKKWILPHFVFEVGFYRNSTSFFRARRVESEI